jgi:hypothetical protein
MIYIVHLNKMCETASRCQRFAPVVRPEDARGDNGVGAPIMLRRFVELASGLAIVLIASGLSGCADTGAIYPSISDVSDLTKILTPQERDKTVNDLSTEQQKHGEAAAKAIEKR